ncbi:hypothetical protein PUN28_000878 [Cardiocondyla obscurior]|uniref:Uncharacterized protein n=1 Tax=Cardiocondyla obscurior TaxID=286306 RepID=A0AAW2H225_9HYME
MIVVFFRFYFIYFQSKIIVLDLLPAMLKKNYPAYLMRRQSIFSNSNRSKSNRHHIHLQRLCTNRVRCCASASLQIGCSANDNQNSHASNATPSSTNNQRLSPQSSNYLHTFFRTSESSSEAKWKRFSKKLSICIISACVR